MERSGGAGSLSDRATGERPIIDPLGGNIRGIGEQGSRRYPGMSTESRVHHRAGRIPRYTRGKTRTLRCPVFAA